MLGLLTLYARLRLHVWYSPHAREITARERIIFPGTAVWLPSVISGFVRVLKVTNRARLYGCCKGVTRQIVPWAHM